MLGYIANANESSSNLCERNFPRGKCSSSWCGNLDHKTPINNQITTLKTLPWMSQNVLISPSPQRRIIIAISAWLRLITSMWRHPKTHLNSWLRSSSSLLREIWVCEHDSWHFAYCGFVFVRSWMCSKVFSWHTRLSFVGNDSLIVYLIIWMPKNPASERWYIPLQKKTPRIWWSGRTLVDENTLFSPPASMQI